MVPDTIMKSNTKIRARILRKYAHVSIIRFKDQSTNIKEIRTCIDNSIQVATDIIWREILSESLRVSIILTTPQLTVT